MPAFGPITLTKDGGTTTSTYSPAQIKGDIAAYEDRTTGVSIEYPRFTASVVRPSKTSRVSKVRLKLVVPVLEAVTGTNLTGVTPAPVVAYTLSSDVTFLLPERCSLADRQAILSLITSALGTTMASSLVVDNESIY